MNKYDKIIAFIQHLKNPENGKYIELMPYQLSFITEYCKPYSYHYLFIPKKNGKTTLNAGLMLYELWNPKNVCRELYSISVTMKQAKQSFKYACQFIYQDSDLQKLFHIHNTEKRITNRKTGTTWEVISADDKKGRIHSIKPYIVLYDEISFCQEESTYTAIENSIKDDDGKFLMITHAGDRLDWFGYETYRKAKQIASGEVINTDWHVQLYEAPADANIEDENVWLACNPGIGVTKSLKKMKAGFDSAKGSPATLNKWRILQLNQWIEISQNAFIDVRNWDKCFDKDTDKIIETTKDSRDKLLIVDLSLKTDLTSITALFKPCIDDEYYRVKNWFLKPSNSLADHSLRDNYNYGDDVTKGYLILSAGDIIKQQDITTQVLKLRDTYGINTVLFDDYMAAYMMNDYVALGIDVINYPNTIKDMTTPTKALQELILTSKIRHDGNRLLRKCIHDTVCLVDRNENMAPSKKHSRGRIDGTVSLIMGLGVFIAPETDSAITDPNLIYG